MPETTIPHAEMTLGEAEAYRAGRDAARCADPIVEAVRADLAARSALGQAKYGTTLARTDLTRAQWLTHAYQEALDLALYLRRLIEAEPPA
jgi:hypothetical protein